MFCRSLLLHLSCLWLLYSLYFFDLRLLITSLVCCGHCAVCPSSIHDFWLPLWYLRYTASDYPLLVSSIYGFWLPPFGVFYLRLLITSLWCLLFTASDYSFGIFKLILQHWTNICGVMFLYSFCSSLFVPFLLVIVLSVILCFQLLNTPLVSSYFSYDRKYWF